MPEPRTHLAIPVPVRLERSDGRHSVEYALNLSPGGLCLQLREPLADGEDVTVHFDVPGLGISVSTPARVVWSQASKPDAHGELHTETGLRFSELDDEIRARLFEFATQPRSEGR